MLMWYENQHLDHLISDISQLLLSCYSSGGSAYISQFINYCYLVTIAVVVHLNEVVHNLVISILIKPILVLA